MKAFTLRALFFGLLAIVFFEIVFRTIVPASSFPFTCSDPETGILRYDPELGRDGVFTTGRLAEVRVPWHINNAGWNAGIDYRRPAERDGEFVVAITGNSYIEGLNVHWDEHVAHLLSERLGPDSEAYSFGYSGTPLSENLRVGPYVVERYDPDLLVLFVAVGDLLGSMRSHGRRPLSVQLVREGDRLIETKPPVYKAGRTRWARSSAIARYLMTNANLKIGGGGLAVADVEDEGATEVADRIDGRQAALAVLSRLRERLPETELLLLVDANRKAIYEGDDEAVRSFEAQLLQPVCDSLGIALLSLDEAFLADWKLHHERFNFDHNYHWNARGNAVAAEALANYLQADRTLASH